MDEVVLWARQRRPRGGGRPTCIDVFSGAGGLAEGFRSAGWNVISATDQDCSAGKTFRSNFPESSFFQGPISKVHPRALLEDATLRPGELDCLIGGPPCQSFSFNNHARSASDERARLFRYYLRLVRALRPKTLLMENVPGMLTIGGGEVLAAIRVALLQMGYQMGVKILYAEEYGVPQQRRRVFILATRLGWDEMLFPNGTHIPAVKPSDPMNPFVHRWNQKVRTRLLPSTTVWEAISDLPRLGNGEQIDSVPYSSQPESNYQRLMRKRSAMIYNHVTHALTAPMLRRITHVPEGGNWRDIPFEMLPAGMRRAKPNCHTTRYGRLNRHSLARTILTKCDPHWGCYVHPMMDRTISVREAARLQSFPDRFRFAGPRGSQYEQVGNAVPPLLAAALGRSVHDHLANRCEADEPCEREIA